MFEIAIQTEGDVALEGRLDAAQAEKAQAYLDQYPDTEILDLSNLEYVSSAGLGVFLKVHKRLADKGAVLRLTNVNVHILDIFKYSGFDKLFVIEAKE